LGSSGSGCFGSNQFYAANGAKSATNANQRIVYDSSAGNLYYDADGAGGAAAVRIATLGQAIHPVLDHTDVYVLG